MVDSTAFVKGEWGAEIVDSLAPQEGDVVVEGKRGLDTFATTNLDFILRARGITTIALGGFLTNCCVESTMRTGYEKGYEVITLSDCVAATSAEEHDNAIKFDYPMFSEVMTSESFAGELQGAPVAVAGQPVVGPHRQPGRRVGRVVVELRCDAGVVVEGSEADRDRSGPRAAEQARPAARAERLAHAALGAEHADRAGAGQQPKRVGRNAPLGRRGRAGVLAAARAVAEVGPQERGGDLVAHAAAQQPPRTGASGEGLMPE